MSKIVIVGKNSAVFKRVSPFLNEAVAISHKEVDGFNFAGFDYVILFSWSHTNFDDNLNLVKLIPGNKIIFISTVAVLSLQLRPQWSKYPNWKKCIEDYVLNVGGKVVRLGICDPEIKKRYYGLIPVTYPCKLAAKLNSCEELTRQITHLFDLENGELDDFRRNLGRFIYQISKFLPSSASFQVSISLVLRFLRVFNYGYTGDAFQYFNETLLVGYGVLGAAYYQNAEVASKISIVVSYLKNKRLDNYGFRNTLIGYYKNGLGGSWHGVSVIRQSNGVFKKWVPIINKRPSPPSGHLKGNVKEFIIDGDVVETVIDHFGKSLLFFSSKIVLAAGPIENINILQKGEVKSAKLSDHEVGMLGVIDRKEAIEKGLIQIHKWFVSPGDVLVQELDGFKMLMDFRPHVVDKHSGNRTGSVFYLDSTKNLIIKLIAGFSFSRINEAIFNKFGIGIRTRKISVCCQILVENCVQIYADGTATRLRVQEDQIELLQRGLSKKFYTFVPDKKPDLIDSQHLFGGGEFLCSTMHKGHVKAGKIIILGSPTNWCLGATHHTKVVCDSIKAGAYNPLEQVRLY